jgi:hypothetical protein
MKSYEVNGAFDGKGMENFPWHRSAEELFDQNIDLYYRISYWKIAYSVV